MNNYIENNQYIKNDATNSTNPIKEKSHYERKSILDTSLYKKYENLRIEKWKILLR